MKRFLVSPSSFIIVIAALFLIALLPLIRSEAARHDDVPRFEPGECVVPVPADAPTDVECGFLIVPENHDQTDNGRTIQLPVAIIHSIADNPAPDPFIYPTTGGPGGGTLVTLPHWLDDTWILDNRDIILVEQRGTEYAEPRLECPGVENAEFENYGLSLPLDEEMDRVAQAAAVCRDRLTAEGIDLAAYNSAQSAADLADLRRVLGYDQWNLYGISYGGRLTLTVMRDQPEGLRSVILDSAYAISLNKYEEVPGSFARSLDQLFEGCAADPGCAADYPNLEAQFYRVVDRLDADPFPVNISHPVTGEPFTLLLTGEALTDGLFNALYDAEVIRVIPYLIDQIDRGSMDVVLPLAEDGFDSLFFQAWGMYYSVECREEWPFNDPEAVQAANADLEARFSIFRTDTVICPIWGVPPADAVENERVVSDIPALILTGEYDPIHPSYWSERMAETLSNHFFYEFPGVGHGALFSSDCSIGIANEFLDDPTVEPYAGCIDNLTGPDFFTRGDIYATPGFYRLNKEVLEGSSLPQTGLLVIGLGVFLAGGIATVITLFPRRRQLDAPEWIALLAAQVAALLVALLNVIFAVALVSVATSADFIILGFGLPAGAAPALLLPAAAVIFDAILIVLVVVAWSRRYWSRARRVFFTVIAVAGAAFAVWLAYIGLLILPR